MLRENREKIAEADVKKKKPKEGHRGREEGRE